MLQFTELEKVGDVDFFKFRAKAGQILVARNSSPGSWTRFIGLFDPSGVLIAFDDDGGAASLSRLARLRQADGDYVVGVTTWPDVGFAGATETGRYVLSVQALEGQIIPLTDDGSIDVPLGFSFPFQGTTVDECVRERQRQPDLRRAEWRLHPKRSETSWPDRRALRRSGTISFPFRPGRCHS